MSRRAAATSAGRMRKIPRSPAHAAPRRVSGPAARNHRDAEGWRGGLAYADTALAPRPRMSPQPRAFEAPRPQALGYGGAAIASRVAGVAVGVSASPLMDRLVRSRVWIGIVAFSLIGLVAMQVSLLKLNSGIGRAVQTASTLERSNATLRAEISTLSAGDRIQRLAAARGMVMPAPADVSYLRAGRVHTEAVRAARNMRGPNPTTLAGPAGAPAHSAAPLAAAPPGTPQPTARVTTAQGTSTPPGTGPARTASPGVATGGSAPATQPAGSTPPRTAASQPSATATATPPGAVTGGAAPQATNPTP